MPLKRNLIAGSTFRLITVLAFVAACLVFLGYLWAQAGGTLPGLSAQRSYNFSVETDNVVNAVPFTDVEIAGVPVGKVDSIVRDGARVRLNISLDQVAVPLHRGATVQISEKSLAGQPLVRLVDGTGPEIPSGTRLPDNAVLPAVTLRDVLASLDPKTLASLGGTVRAMGVATDGRTHDLSNLMAGLADLGRNGDTALDAIAAQSNDLQRLSTELTTVFDALDTGQGEIADLVSNANRLTSATAGQKRNLEDSVRKLPPLLRGASSTSEQFDRISGSLAPIATDLRAAAPDLNKALLQLPATSADLRGLLPDLQSVLDQAPTTLKRVPSFGETTRDLIPPATSVLLDLNPALRYIKPYGHDIAQLISNFGAAFHHYAADGKAYAYVRPIFQPLSVRPQPVRLPHGLLTNEPNPYPGPGELTDLRPFSGAYPRVERDGG
jgi:phospholipid/cholesterol/gamma-HCH transport system substrate-binding protein